MKRMVLGAVAALALVGAGSVSAQTAVPGEMLLHIETVGVAKPDMATVTLTARGTGKDEKEARAKLAAAAAAIRSKLAAAGLAASAIKDGEVDVSAMPDYAAQSAAMDASAQAAADAAMAAAAAVGNDDTMAHDAAAIDMPMLQQASLPITVTVADLAKLEAVIAAGQNDGDTPSPRTFYSTRDPQAAHTRAVQDALAKARTEADGYAAALGYRVVRMVSVSSAKPKPNWPDLMGLASGFDGPGNAAEQEMLRLVASTYAGAQIDYAIAPK